MRMTNVECHNDVELMLRRSFEMVRGRVEFYPNSDDRKAALVALDRCMEITLSLAKQELMESLNAEQIRLRQVR